MGCQSSFFKKILIMVFDDNYLTDLCYIITKNKIQLSNQIGFYNFKDRAKNILYTFLTNNQRWTWIHHFPGTYGTIIVYEGKDTINNIIEIDNITNSKYLIKRPLLLIFDKNKLIEKDKNFINTITSNLEKKNMKLIVQIVDFKTNQENNELIKNIEWLEKEIRNIGEIY